MNSVGIECELTQRAGGVEKHFLSSSPLEVPFVEKGLTLTHEREYYEHQHEIIARPFKKDEDGKFAYGFDKFRSIIDDTLTKVPSSGLVERNFNSVPVGTHIHLFLERSGIPFGGRKDVKMRVTWFVLSEIYKFLTECVEKKTMPIEAVAYELNRLTRSHCILRYFDSERLDNAHKHSLELLGLRYLSFHNGIDRKKYSPVIWSLPREGGKKMSLEIRLIPNTMLMNKDGAYWDWFVKEIVTLVNEPTEDNDSFKKRISLLMFGFASTLRTYLVTGNDEETKATFSHIKKIV